jgi:hypothetical protein
MPIRKVVAFKVAKARATGRVLKKIGGKAMYAIRGGEYGEKQAQRMDAHKAVEGLKERGLKEPRGWSIFKHFYKK